MLNRRGFSVERLAYSKKKEIFFSYLSAKKGFTLVELFIAIALAGMVLLPITAVDIVSRKFLNNTNYESRVQNEAAPTLERIAKDIARGYGNASNPGVIVPTSTEVQVRGLDAAMPPTYDIFTDDPWVRYRYDSTTFSIIKESCTGSPFNCSPWGAAETLANNISACSFTIALDALFNKNLWVTIAITARRNAADTSPPSPTNPEVILQTTIAAHSQSVH